MGISQINAQNDNTADNNLGADYYGVGYDSGGSVYINGSNVQTLGTWSAGANIGVCVNVEYQQIWFRVNGGNWNNNSSNNPAASPPTGGLSLSSLAVSSYSPACGASAAASFTLNATSGSWTYSAPTGYAAISAVTPVAEFIGSNQQTVRKSTPPAESVKCARPGLAMGWQAVYRRKRRYAY